jgi:hypothetical protein
VHGQHWKGNADFPFKRGLLTRGRARFKHGVDVEGEFLSPSYEFTFNVGIDLLF